MTEKFCLKWNDFQSNVANSFRRLRSEEDFHDVTLVSDDRHTVSAHKIILSASSEYFKAILKSNKHSHPMLCLPGVNSGDLQNILDFIYNGEIQILQEQLDQFLNIAQRFQLEGLTQSEGENNPELQQFEDQHKFIPENQSMDTRVPDDITGMDEIPMKSQFVKTQNIVAMDSANFENIEELDRTINDMIEKVDDNGSTRRCIPCGKISKYTSHAREHAETHIEGLSFPCKYCDKTFRSRPNLRDHIRRFCQKK